MPNWKSAQQLINKFWKTRSDEYITTLRLRSKWKQTTSNIKIGDVILMEDENQKSSWKKGRIVEIYPAKCQRMRR